MKKNNMKIKINPLEILITFYLINIWIKIIIKINS